MFVHKFIKDQYVNLHFDYLNEDWRISIDDCLRLIAGFLDPMSWSKAGLICGFSLKSWIEVLAMYEKRIPDTLHSFHNEDKKLFHILVNDC